MPQDRKEYQRQYKLKNKEKIRQQRKQYRIKNKEKLSHENKEYHKTEAGRKSWLISNWKYQGILCFDWDLIHELYINTTHCEFCNCELNVKGTNKKCLDHDHSINNKFNIRGVLCHSCNIKDVLI